MKRDLEIFKNFYLKLYIIKCNKNINIVNNNF